MFFIKRLNYLKIKKALQKVPNLIIFLIFVSSLCWFNIKYENITVLINEHKNTEAEIQKDINRVEIKLEKDKNTTNREIINLKSTIGDLESLIDDIEISVEDLENSFEKERVKNLSPAERLAETNARILKLRKILEQTKK